MQLAIGNCNFPDAGLDLLVAHTGSPGPRGGRGLRYLALAGLAGVVIDGTIIPLAARVIFPPLLSGWNGFGPIDVAMALMTWCGVIGIGWVVTACVGAVLWERTAPSETVIESQSDVAPDRLDDV